MKRKFRIIKTKDEDLELYPFCKEGMILAGKVENGGLSVETDDLIQLNREKISDKDIKIISFYAKTIMRIKREKWLFPLWFLEEITEEKGE